MKERRKGDKEEDKEEWDKRWRRKLRKKNDEMKEIKLLLKERWDQRI